MSASREHVSITDPDDPFGSPAYDGPAADAAARLRPGVYEATTADGDPVHVVIGNGTVVLVDNGVAAPGGKDRRRHPARLPVASRALLPCQ